MSHQLQVNIDPQKSKLYVKTAKNKAEIFQRHQFFRFKSRQTLNSRSKWTMFFAQREIIFTHRLTLDESYSCPSRLTVLYMYLKT